MVRDRVAEGRARIRALELYRQARNTSGSSAETQSKFSQLMNKDVLAKEGLKTSEGGRLFFNDKGQVVGYEDPILKQSYAFSKPYNYSNIQELNRVVQAERNLQQSPMITQTKTDQRQSTAESLKPSPLRSSKDFPSVVSPVTSETYKERLKGLISGDFIPQTGGLFGSGRGDLGGQFLASGGTPFSFLGYSAYERYGYPTFGTTRKFATEFLKEKSPKGLKFIPDVYGKVSDFFTKTPENRALGFGITSQSGIMAGESFLKSVTFPKLNIRSEESITKELTKYAKKGYTETTTAGAGTAKIESYRGFGGFLGKVQDKGFLPKIDLQTFEIGAFGRGTTISKGRSFVSGNIGTGGIRSGSDVFVFPLAGRSFGKTTSRGYISDIVPASYLEPKTTSGDLSSIGKSIITNKKFSLYSTKTEGGIVTGEGYADVSGKGTSLYLKLPEQPSFDSGFGSGGVSFFTKQTKQNPSFKSDLGSTLIKETLSKGKDVLKTDTIKVMTPSKPIFPTSSYKTDSGITSTKQEFKMDLKPSNQGLVIIPRQDIKLKSDLKFSYKTPSTNQRTEGKMGLATSTKTGETFKFKPPIIPDIPITETLGRKTTPPTAPTFNFGSSYKLPPLIPLIPPIGSFLPSGGSGGYGRIYGSRKQPKEYKPTLYAATVKLEVPRIGKKEKLGAETGLGARPIPSKKIKLKKWF